MCVVSWLFFDCSRVLSSYCPPAPTPTTLNCNSLICSELPEYARDKYTAWLPSSSSFAICKVNWLVIYYITWIAYFMDAYALSVQQYLLYNRQVLMHYSLQLPLMTILWSRRAQSFDRENVIVRHWLHSYSGGSQTFLPVTQKRDLMFAWDPN